MSPFSVLPRRKKRSQRGAKSSVVQATRAAAAAGLGAVPPCAPHRSQLSGGAYAGSQVMPGFAEAARATQISPLNAKNLATADPTDQMITTMMKSLMRGADFTATVDNANTQLQNMLSTGSGS